MSLGIARPRSWSCPLMILPAAWLVLAAAGCGEAWKKENQAPKPLDEANTPTALPDYRFQTVVAEAGVEARVSVPPGQGPAVGTWVAAIRFPDGRTQTLTRDRDGAVSNVWLRDLGGDGVLDLIVNTTSAGTGSYGAVALYRLADSLFVEHRLAPLDEDQEQGYMGHDTYSLLDGKLYRSFPVYAASDPTAKPTGGHARLLYSFEDDRWVPAP